MQRISGGGFVSIAFMFPGQGSQFVGMGREVYEAFPAARDVFKEVDEVLGRSLSEIIFYGPDEELTATANAQLALFTVSMALMRAFEKAFGCPVGELVRYMAGHSVGEYTALCASGVIDLRSAVRLLAVRGEAMGKVAALSLGGMSACVGGEFCEIEAVVKAAEPHGVCEIANDNCEGQVVVSGVEKALEALPSLIKGTGVKRVVRLRVAGPFHCSLMYPAYEEVRDFIRSVKMSTPGVGLVLNVSACEHDDCSVIRDMVAKQVVRRVQWRRSVEYMVQRGCSSFVEMGPGSVLSGLLKRIDSSVRGLTVGTVESLDALLEYCAARGLCKA